MFPLRRKALTACAVGEYSKRSGRSGEGLLKKFAEIKSQATAWDGGKTTQQMPL
jgi:hypothetical protein